MLPTVNFAFPSSMIKFQKLEVERSVETSVDLKDLSILSDTLEDLTKPQKKSEDLKIPRRPWKASVKLR